MRMKILRILAAAVSAATLIASSVAFPVHSFAVVAGGPLKIQQHTIRSLPHPIIIITTHSSPSSFNAFSQAKGLAQQWISSNMSQSSK